MTRFRKLGLAALAVLALSGCRVEVYDKLSQRDANEMTALLLMAGVDAKRITQKDGLFAVTVSESDFAEAVTLIDRSGLPKPSFASMSDVLNDERLIASPSEERARLNYALSQELSRTVSEIEGVVIARVHLATPSNDPLSRRDATDSSASVAIHHRADFAATGVVPRIKVLVANAVDGLDYDRVSIALFPTLEGSGPRPVQTVSSSEYDFEDPTPLRPQAAVATPAKLGGGGGISPMMAVIMAGGLIVLFLAGQAIVNGMRRKTVRIEDDTPRRRAKR
jgi:type III secretion protein J